MVFLATIDPSPRLQPIKFPVFSQLAGNLASETGSLETASSTGESSANRIPELWKAPNAEAGQTPHLSGPDLTGHPPIVQCGRNSNQRD
jgi:hypothetical protein